MTTARIQSVVIRSKLCATATLLIMLATLQSCVNNPLTWDPEQHVVQKGESLEIIALRYQITVRDLVAWNAIKNPDLIKAGRRLRVAKPAGWQDQAAANPSVTTRPPTSAPPENWFWPAEGEQVPQINAAGVGDGINIASQEGSPVFATADGTVVYGGSGLTGYGNLLIIKHNDTYLSAYGYNQNLLVSEGDAVRGGQRIATMGLGPGRRPQLHFEIRRHGKPVDPLQFLKAK